MEIHMLKNANNLRIKSLELDKQQQSNAYSNRLDDIEKRRIEERRKTITSFSGRGFTSGALNPTLNEIDKKYEKEKQMAQKENDYYQKKLQIEIEALRDH